MKGALLVNLGSPKSTQLEDIKSYLDEFLMDGRVIDYPYWLRNLVVRGIILKTRPPKTQANYKRIWDNGSPLIVYTENLCHKVSQNVAFPIEMAMRYGEPSLKNGLRNLSDKGVNEVLIIPLFPQFAMATIESATARIDELAKEYFPSIKTTVLPPFYNQPEYIEVMAKNIKRQLKEIEYDHLLFSYHGVPERHIRKSDITNGHCKMDGQCCQTPSEAHKYCYRHQCLETTRLITQKLNLKKETYSHSFQSRLGLIPWLKPYTAKHIPDLAKNGIEKLAIVSPAFVADCIETIDELGREAKELFIENGGKEFHLISCLNDRQDWANVLSKWMDEWAGKKPEKTEIKL